MTRITILPTADPHIEIEGSTIENINEENVDSLTSFQIVNNNICLFKILTNLRNINDDNPNGLFISVIEYDPLVIGSAVLRDCLTRFQNAVRYTMMCNENNYHVYKYEYMWFMLETQDECLLSDYIDFGLYLNDGNISIYQNIIQR